jgi:hypothetical protein
MQEDGTNTSSAQQHWHACTGMCIVLQLKKFLIQAYCIKEGMLQAHIPDGKRYETPFSVSISILRKDMSSPVSPRDVLVTMYENVVAGQMAQ